jgi:ABC-type histidine transport system ATPase subunit
MSVLPGRGAPDSDRADGSPRLAIEVGGRMRSFGETTVLAGVGVVLEPGGVFGLLGPHGAGKTTTVRILTDQPLPGPVPTTVLAPTTTRKTTASSALQPAPDNRREPLWRTQGRRVACSR